MVAEPSTLAFRWRRATIDALIRARGHSGCKRSGAHSALIGFLTRYIASPSTCPRPAPSHPLALLDAPTALRLCVWVAGTMPIPKQIWDSICKTAKEGLPA